VLLIELADIDPSSFNLTIKSLSLRYLIQTKSKRALKIDFAKKGNGVSIPKKLCTSKQYSFHRC